MKLTRLFRTKKSRKYPIKWGERGRSARSRCFEMFAEGVPLNEIARTLEVKIDTVGRYHRQYRQDLGFEERYKYGKSLFEKTSPYRDKNIELYARVWGFSTDQLETILSQPHGLLRLITGKICTPAHEAAGYKQHRALELALMITEHLVKQGGSFEDAYYAFQHWMQENMKQRKEEDAEIKDENRDMEIMHAVLKADAERDRESRVKPDRLSEKESNANLQWGADKAMKRLAIDYWLRIAELTSEGITPEQAREKMYQDLLTKGDGKGAKMVREFQDRVHPLKNNDQKSQ
jgi:hypothetical protein